MHVIHFYEPKPHYIIIAMMGLQYRFALSIAHGLFIDFIISDILILHFVGNDCLISVVTILFKLTFIIPTMSCIIFQYTYTIQC